VYRLGPLIFVSWQSLYWGNGWSDTFVFPLHPQARLPPRDYADVIRKIASTLRRLRRGASLWAPVTPAGKNGDGAWFCREVQATLHGLCVPFAVTQGYAPAPQEADFSFRPGVYPQPHPAPPQVEAARSGRQPLSAHELDCLRVLARLEKAATLEVASLAGVSLPTARSALKALLDRRFVALEGSPRSPFWKPMRPGLSAALRSWGVPPGVPFEERKERAYAQGRHRRMARLWPARLRREWPQAEVWSGWSEVSLEARLRPDALAWGRLDGHETLFWAEVESGHTSHEKLWRKTADRFNRALAYTRQFDLRLVFALLAPPWVQRSGIRVFRNLPKTSAVVVAGWLDSNDLPVPGWGRARM